MRALAWWGTNRSTSLGLEPGLGQRLVRRLHDHPDRMPEDLLAVHVQVAAVIALEKVAQGPVRPEVPGQQLARPVGGLEQHRAGPVTDEDGDAAVVPVRDLRQRLAADDEYPLRTGEHEAVGGDERVDEPRARGVDVEGTAADPEAFLHRGRCPRHERVRCGGGEHEHVDVVAGSPGPRQGLGSLPRWRTRPWSPRSVAHGSRCARRSTGHWCRGAPRGPRW